MGSSGLDITEAISSAIPDPFFIFDEHGYYVDVIGGIDRRKYHDGQHLIGKRIKDVMSAELANTFVSKINEAIEAQKVLTFYYKLAANDIRGSETLPGPEGEQRFRANIPPIKSVVGKPRMVVWVAFNITDLHNTIEEKKSLIEKLEKANKEIRTLRQILPICSYCKKIRDDKGYWNQLEAYIHQHTGTEFTHGICEECVKEHFPNLNIPKHE